MNYRKHGLKALGLSFLAVLGFMAFAVSGAQASGKLTVLDSDGTPLTNLSVGITGAEDPLTSNDRLRILGLNLELSCPEAEVHNALLTGAGHGSATVLFENCKAQGVDAGGNLIGSSCTPTPNKVTAKVLALIILHEGKDHEALTLAQHGTGTGKPYILFTPQDGLTFATVTNSNEECLLPESATVKGCVVARIHTEGHLVQHLIDTRLMLQLFGCVLKYGINEAHIEADAVLELTNSAHGNHQGLKWGVE